ncbi:MAG: hypothetical protein EBQ48_00550, partial [Betaproteobacteria bacterium]|nr:hypothetical protein [Betaproteobacteria bacterium]
RTGALEERKRGNQAGLKTDDRESGQASPRIEPSMTVNPPCRPRNPVAKAVRTPLYKMRVVESKRRKLLEKWTEAVSRGAKDVKGGADER